MSIYEQDLDKNAANFTPLSPVSFVERTAEVFGDLPAVVHGARRYSWAQTRERAARLAAALRALGVSRGATVSTMLSNTPEMVEAHYAVPALNAVLNTLNIRLDAPLLAWQLQHCETVVLITDREFAPVVREVLRVLREEHGRTLSVIDVCDSEYSGAGERLGEYEYEALIARHAPLAQLEGPAGRVGCDRGVLHLRHHRQSQGRRHPSSRRVPERGQQRLRLVACRTSPSTCGRCRCSTATAGASPGRWRCSAGTHVCLRKVEARAILDAIRTHRVDHYCGAPIVHNMLINADPALRARHRLAGARHGGGRRTARAR